MAVRCAVGKPVRAVLSRAPLPGAIFHDARPRGRYPVGMFILGDSERRTRLPLMTVLLVLLCGAVWAWQLSLPQAELEAAIWRWGVVPLFWGNVVANGDWSGLGGTLLTLVTYQFLHGGWLHVLGNVWTLWIFGDNVEERFGRVGFLVFYLGCGALGGLAHLLVEGDAAVPMVGASGAIAGVMGAYLWLFPGAWVKLLVPIVVIPLIVRVPAIVFLAVWFGLQWLSATVTLTSASAGGGVAWFAHIGGFTAGLAFAILAGRKAKG